MASTIHGTTHSILHIGAMQVITILIVVIIIIITITTIIMVIILIMAMVRIIQNQIGAIIIEETKTIVVM